MKRSKRSRGRQPQATVRPWLSPGALAQADHEILCHLLDRCRRIERELGDGLGDREALRRSAPFPLLVAASAVPLVMLWTARGLWLPPTDVLQDGANVIWSTLGRSSDVEKFYILGVILVLVSIYNASRTARSGRICEGPESRTKESPCGLRRGQ